MICGISVNNKYDFSSKALYVYAIIKHCLHSDKNFEDFIIM